MATLPNMGIELPKIKGDRGAWDAKVNTGFGKIDAHDHTAGKGLPITVAALSIDGDLPMNGFAISATGKVVFTPVAALTGGLTTLFVNMTDNELYYRNATGSNIKMTSGAGLNISLLGGIVGDYASVGAEVAYDDANKRYTFKQQGSPKPWARIACGPVRIYEYSTTESVYVEHAVAGGLAAPYTVTWPDALPATQQMMQISASGQVVFSNTLATDQNLELQGTAYIKRGQQTEWLPFGTQSMWFVNSGSAPAWPAGPSSTLCVEVPASADVYYPLMLGHEKKRLVSVVVNMRSFTAATTLSLYRTTGTWNVIGPDSSIVVTLSGGGTTVNVPADSLLNPRTLTLQTPYDQTLPAHVPGELIFLRVQAGSGGARLKSYGLVTDVV